MPQKCPHVESTRNAPIHLDYTRVTVKTDIRRSMESVSWIFKVCGFVFFILLLKLGYFVIYFTIMAIRSNFLEKSVNNLSGTNLSLYFGRLDCRSLRGSLSLS